jgi:ribokinase
MTKNILVIGSSNTDMIIKMKKMPKPGETVIGGKFSTAAGGKGANQAVAAARAGGNVQFIGRVGSDIFGETALKGFIQDGLNVDHIIKDTIEPSGVALIFVDENAENSIAVASGANGALSPQDIKDCEHIISSAEILLLQLETPVDTIETAAKIAAKNNVKVILNPAPAQKLSKDLLKNISIITPNETEAELLVGFPITNEKDAESAAKILMELGIKIVIVSLGSKGAFVLSDTFCGVVPAFSVKAIDTTAAGDVFNGAIAVGLSEGKNIKDAVVFANAAAALSVTKMGAQTSAPRREEIDKFILSNAK